MGKVPIWGLSILVMIITALSPSQLPAEIDFFPPKHLQTREISWYLIVRTISTTQSNKSEVFHTMGTEAFLAIIRNQGWFGTKLLWDQKFKTVRISPGSKNNWRNALWLQQLYKLYTSIDQYIYLNYWYWRPFRIYLDLTYDLSLKLREDQK